jgi:Fe2+ transport system protein FeoA
MNARSDPPLKTLGSLRHGDRALVVDVGEGDPRLGAKFAARGLVPGVEIGVLRGGDPILLAIDESRWAVTRNDADLVQVDVIRRTGRSLLQRLWRR